MRDSYKFFAEPVNAAEDPMDFATITTKLSKGKYETLEEFEHDVFLVFSNVMLFNGSDTIYYRQARVIKEVAEKLFSKLRASPVDFETEFSMPRQAADHRQTTTASRLLNPSSCSWSITEGAAGSRGETKIESAGQRRDALDLFPSLLGESETFSSVIQNGLNALMQANRCPVNYGEHPGYNGRLLEYMKSLGPVSQMVGMRNLCNHDAETSHRPHATSSYQLKSSSGNLVPGCSGGWEFPAASVGENSRRSPSNRVSTINISKGGENPCIFAQRKFGHGQSSVVAPTGTPIENWGGCIREGVHPMNKWSNLHTGFPQDMGYAPPLGSSFPVSASTNLTSSAWKTESEPRERCLLNSTQRNMQVINLVRATEMKSSYLGMQGGLPVRNGGVLQSFHPWRTDDTMRSIHNRGAEIAIGIHPTSDNDRAVFQLGWRYRGGFGEAGQDSNCLSTAPPRALPFMSRPPRAAARPIEIDFLGPPGMLRQQQSQPSGGAVENESGFCDDAAQGDRKGKSIMRAADDLPRRSLS
ncbi:uncharacterized protein LOC116197844 isoform X1 [Punica granatum]|uniref:Uncharacterized protein LOC116197844 isoform X1 n=3 Tax=Punica granatum TaxID=22663 RepID=A0A6P8CRQ4_PUNGR|nr:uncharacterized protein LOC116197844 isoform X1 [Punica granatum]XP_031383967.1 uncharacterized protein LOC116197844 isoform X1 [Punica granatum]XP_031383973.1 uncharacterized protein LOC116197844 isoform X1 [Punica granatum]XP_031383981.1 uncharacterized protein LOC116197844 isoform X1 [Punica granatum]XP_031383991.1 uncharacterized protein LOC116197844 isoform X1 [Punica granatum]